MSVKEMKEELAALGGSAEGCYERTEMEARLLEVRAAQGNPSSHSAAPAAPGGGAAGGAAPPPGMEHFMASMTTSFNTMGDSFGFMVSALFSRFSSIPVGGWSVGAWEWKRGL